MKAETENKLIAEFMGIKTKVYSDTPTITYFWKDIKSAFKYV